jgi:uncharacterized protein YjeT (DUF2065 family)
MNLRGFARWTGVFFLLLGIAGFFLSNLFGIIHFDLLHNLFHLGVGILGILASTSIFASKRFAKGLGLVYMLLGITGFFVPELFGHMMLEMSENLLHLIVGSIALYIGYVVESRSIVKVTR